MANPWHHAVSSSRKWGGRPEDYVPVHEWFDATKAWMPDFRHRAIRHHSEGIFECMQAFGTTITLSTGKQIPVRWIGEQHVQEDLGHIPTAADWLRRLQAEPWMNRSRKLSRELDDLSQKEIDDIADQTGVHL
jgi:Domain of unknown function (DUF6915)